MANKGELSFLTTTAIRVVTLLVILSLFALVLPAGTFASTKPLGTCAKNINPATDYWNHALPPWLLVPPTGAHHRGPCFNKPNTTTTTTSRGGAGATDSVVPGIRHKPPR